MTALVDATNTLQVAIAGTDAAQIASDSSHNVIVKDSTSTVVFTGPAASTLAGIHVAPAGLNDIIDLTGVGATTDFSAMVAVNVEVAAGATTILSGTISTTGGQLYAPNVLLAGDTTLASVGGNIGFGGAIESNGAPHNLELHSLGEVFSGNVGDAPGGALGLLTTNGAGTSVINAAVVKAATLTFNDDIVLKTSTTLTGTTAVGFAKTINTDGTTHDLAIDSPGVLFGGEVGAVNPLGTFIIDGTTPGVGTTFVNTDAVKAATLAFNDDVVLKASTTLTGTTAVSFAKTVNTDGTARDLTIDSPSTTFNGNLGAIAGDQLGVLTTDAAGTTFINAGAINGATLAFNDDVVLQATTTLAGTTSVSFAKTVNTDGTARDLTINSPSTIFNGIVGATAGDQLGALTTDAAGTTFINAGIIIGATLAFNDDVVLKASTTLTGTAAVSFAKTINTDGTARDLTINSPSTTFNGNVGATAGDQLGVLTTDAAGTTFINAAVVNAATLAFNDDVVLQASTTLNGTTSVAFAKTINTDGTARDLTINSPSTTFNGNVGATAGDAIGVLTTDAAGTTFINAGLINSATLAFNDDVVLQAATTLNGTTSVAFAKTINTDGAARDLTVNSPSTTFNGNVGATAGDQLGTLTTDAAGTTFINAGVVNGASLVFNDDVVLQAATTLTGTTAVSFAKTVNTDGTARDLTIDSPSTTFNGNIGAAAGDQLGTLTTDAAGTTFINAGVVDGATLAFNDDVVLKTTTALTGATLVDFAKTLISDGTPQDLTINGANTIFQGAVGGGSTLDSLSIAGATDLNGGAVKTVNDQIYHGAVTLSADANLTSSGGNIQFLAAVDGDFNLQMNTFAGHATTFAGPTGVGAALASLNVSGAADLNGGPLKTVNGQLYGAAVKLTADASLSSTLGSISFNGAVDGGFDLITTTFAGGATNFMGPVGVATALNLLTINGAADLNGDQVNTVRDQTYNGAVALSKMADLSSTAGNIKFLASVDGAFDLTTTTAAPQASIFAGLTGAGVNLKTLTVIGAADLNGGQVNTSGAQIYGGPVTLGAPTVTLHANASVIDFQSSVDSDATAARNLVIAGSVLFGDGLGDDFVGKLHPLASLTTSGGAVTEFNVAGSSAASPTVTTTGSQSYGEPVLLIAGTVLVGTHDNANISFGGTIDSLFSGVSALTVDTSGDRPSGKFGTVQFNGNVGTTPLASLTVIAGGPFTVASGISLTAKNDISITVAEATPAAAGDDLVVNGAIHSSAGAIILQAGDNVSINASASIISPTSVTIRGDFNNNDAPGGSTILLAGTINSPVTNVFGGAGNDTINVQKTTTGITTIDAGAGDDVINVSSTAPAAGGVTAPIAAAVVVQGGAGSDTLNVDDSGDAAPNVTGVLTSSKITGLGADITYDELEQLNLFLGSGPNLTLNVQSTLATTPVNVTGKGVGVVNVGNGNRLDDIQGALTVHGVHLLNLNDQSSAQKQTYDISNTAVARPGTSPHVLVVYVDVAVVAVNSGGNDDTFNLFLPTKSDQPLFSTLQLNGGGGQNVLNVVASQTGPASGFTYFAHVGSIGGADRIQIDNIQKLYMYGSPVDSNDFANDTSTPAVLIGGENSDILQGGSGQDVLFGGGALPGNAVGDRLISGGSLGHLQDFVFAEFRPVFNPDGTVSMIAFPGNAHTTLDAGGGSAVSQTPGNSIFNATTVVQIDGVIDVLTWLTARFVSPQNVDTIVNDALTNDPLLSIHQPLVPFSATRPADLPVAPAVAGALDPALTAYVKNAYESALGRDPGASESAVWVARLSGGLSRASFANQLTHSDEYFAGVVTRAYSNFLGRLPDAAGLNFWVAQMRDQGLTDERLEVGFIGSAEYFAKAGGTNLGWVDKMYQDLLQRSPDAQGEAYWVAQLQAGAQRADVAYGFAASLERERSRVTDDYLQYLNRSPDSQGVDYWVNQFAHGQTNENLIAGFLGSDEYFATHSN